MSELIDREALENWVRTEMASLDTYEDKEYVIERWRKELPSVAAPRWHRVEGELPEPNIQCLVRDDDNNCAVGYYRQDARAWDSPFFGWVERGDEYYEDGDLCRIGKVVAWMPIEPPKEDA